MSNFFAIVLAMGILNGAMAIDPDMVVDMGGSVADVVTKQEIIDVAIEDYLNEWCIV